jgi:hypothetical protein
MKKLVLAVMFLVSAPMYAVSLEQMFNGAMVVGLSGAIYKFGKIAYSSTNISAFMRNPSVKKGVVFSMPFILFETGLARVARLYNGEPQKSDDVQKSDNVESSVKSRCFDGVMAGSLGFIAWVMWESRYQEETIWKLGEKITVKVLDKPMAAGTIVAVVAAADHLHKLYKSFQKKSDDVQKNENAK